MFNDFLKYIILEFPLWLSSNEVMNPTSIMRMQVPSLASMVWGFGIAMSCGVGHRASLDPMLLWLWHRTAAAAVIWALAWAPPCASGAALKRKKNLIALHKMISSFFFFLTYSFFCLFVSFRATLAAYGGSQARGQIRGKGR